MDLARNSANTQRVGVMFWGGHDEAERVVACFGDVMDREAAAWPIVCLRARLNTRFATLTHRDILGAYMALGLTRERAGDIFVTPEAAFFFVLEDNADYIIANLTSAGRMKLAFSRAEGMVALPEPEGVELRDTVASLRLDAVLSTAFGLSRTKAQEAIRAGRIRLNHVEEVRVDADVKEGALLSCRGMGRARLKQVGATTKKGRIGIVCFRYT